MEDEIIKIQQRKSKSLNEYFDVLLHITGTKVFTQSRNAQQMFQTY